MLFVDASALVKRYVRERHSQNVRRLVAAGPIAISRLSEVEVPSALGRICREGPLSRRGRDRALRAFTTDLAAWHIVEVSPEVAGLARAQLLTHELRAGDAIQLASALWLRQSIPVSGLLAFETRLVEAARVERFTNPILG